MAFEKVFFVMCPSFHGATLLAKLLNSHPDIAALGDTYPSNAFDQTCGCGRKISKCSFWQDVKTKLGEYYNPATSAWLERYPGAQILAGKQRFSDYLCRFFFDPQKVKGLIDAQELEHFTSGYKVFLDAISHQPSCQGHIFVDGVKSVMRLSCLIAGGQQVDGVIHLVRDPMDFVASSYKNTKREGLPGLFEHSILYRAYHAKVWELSGSIPTHHVRYEELASDPNRKIKEIFSFIGVEPLTISQLRENFDQEWHFMGNSSLFRFDGTFHVSQHDLPGWQRRLIKVLAGSEKVHG